MPELNGYWGQGDRPHPAPNWNDRRVHSWALEEGAACACGARRQFYVRRPVAHVPAKHPWYGLPVGEIF